MKIIFKNKTRKEIYEKNIDEIKKLVYKYAEPLGFDLRLKVYFVPDVEGVKPAASTYKKGKWFYIYIFDVLFEKEEEEFLECVIYHEFLHIYDLNNIFNNKQIKYKDYRCFFKLVHKPSIYIGLLFWTEFFAYYKCYSNGFYYKSKDFCTFLQMVNKYKKIVKKYETIVNDIEAGENDKKSLRYATEEMIDMINGFVYDTSRYLASLPFEKRNYDYCEKTKQKPEYKEVSKIVDKLIDLVDKMRHGTYGKHLVTRLDKIGTFIIETIYEKFHFKFSNKRLKCTFEYHKEESEE